MVMSPMRPGAKNNCCGEGQQQFSSHSAESVERLESAVSSWEIDPSEVVEDNRPCRKRRIPHCCKPFHSNTESSREVGDSQRGPEPWNKKAEGFAAFGVLPGDNR
jgi:hypothetical protein